MNLFRKLLSVLVFALVLTGTAQTQQQESASESPILVNAEPPSSDASARAENSPNIYPWLAAGLVARGVPAIDVRSAEEVAATGTLANATNIAHTEIEALIQFIGEDRDRTVVLYCGSGRRAGLVIDSLRERGYHGLVNAGGYEDFAEAINQR